MSIPQIYARTETIGSMHSHHRFESCHRHVEVFSCTRSPRASDAPFLELRDDSSMSKTLYATWTRERVALQRAILKDSSHDQETDHSRINRRTHPLWDDSQARWFLISPFLVAPQTQSYRPASGLHPYHHGEERYLQGIPIR